MSYRWVDNLQWSGGLEPHVNASLCIISIVEHEMFEGRSTHQIHGTFKITITQLKGRYCCELLMAQISQPLHIM